MVVSSLCVVFMFVFVFVVFVVFVFVSSSRGVSVSVAGEASADVNLWFVISHGWSAQPNEHLPKHRWRSSGRWSGRWRCQLPRIEVSYSAITSRLENQSHQTRSRGNCQPRHLPTPSQPILMPAKDFSSSTLVVRLTLTITSFLTAQRAQLCFPLLHSGHLNLHRRT